MTTNEAVILESEAQACLASQQLEEARSRYARLCEMQPDNPDSWLMLGALDGELGRTGEAIASVRKAIELDGEFAEACLTLAHLEKARGDNAASLKSVLQSIDIDENYGEAWLFRGALQGEMQDYVEALDSCRKAVSLLPDSPDAQANLGNVLRQLGQYQEAEEAYQKAKSLKPDSIEILAGLANVLAPLGRADEALELLQAIGEQPANPEVQTAFGVAWLVKDELEKALAYFNQRLSLTPDFALGKVHAGMVLRRLKRLDEAEDLFREALHTGTDSTRPLAHNLLGTIRIEEGNPEEALKCYRQALELSPNYVAAMDNCGRALEALGRFEEALEQYRRASELICDSADLAGNQASVLQRLGDNQAALDLIQPFLVPDKVSVRVAEVFSRLCKTVGRCDEAVDLLEHLRASVHEDKDIRPVDFALGRLYDRAGEFDKAFERFDEANKLKRYDYDSAGYTRYIDSIIATFNPGTMGLLPRPQLSSDKPVFIVGMPRSGTSLVEQILASHPGVFGGGELADIFLLVESMPAMLGGLPYPACVPSMTPAVAEKLAGRYVDAIDEMANGAVRVTDKMPHNFQHLGLIHILFPEARIVHCVRDPMDTCLSCYFQEFTGYHPYAYDLANLGSHYREYRRLMAHWKETVGIPMLEVKYEDLVKNQEKVSRSLIEFCGLEWDARCLNFHETERTTRTASFDQVRQPMYRASMERWRNYEDKLDVLRRALGES